MSEHHLAETSTKDLLIFRFGNTSDKSIFREEVHLKIIDSNQIRYEYFWGMPQGEFAYRSGATMKKI